MLHCAVPCTRVSVQLTPSQHDTFPLRFHTDRYTMHSMTPLQHLCRKVITVITTDLTHSQDGYTFWYSLPRIGKYSRHAMLARWSKRLLQLCFPPTLIQAMTLTAFNQNGLPHPEGAPLRAWLLRYVYDQDATQLYQAWFKLHSTLGK